MIGQPICLDGEDVVLVSVNGVTIVDGRTMLTVAKGTLTSCIYVHSNSVLYDSNGDRYANDQMETRQIFYDRLMYNKRNQEENENE